MSPPIGDALPGAPACGGQSPRPEALSPRPEEALEEGGRLGNADAAVDLGRVVAGRLGEDARPVLDALPGRGSHGQTED